MFQHFSRMESRNFTSAEWIKGIKPCILATLKVENNAFMKSRGEEGTPVKINGFPITTKEYQKMLDGEKIILKKWRNN